MKKALLEIDRGCDSRRVRKEKGAGEPLGLHTLNTVFIQGYELKKESKIALKKVELSEILAPEKYFSGPENNNFRTRKYKNGGENM